jgi:hypothetical protein
MVRTISHDYAWGVTWVTERQQSYLELPHGKTSKGEGGIMGWMLDNFGRLIVRLQSRETPVSRSLQRHQISHSIDLIAFGVVRPDRSQYRRSRVGAAVEISALSNLLA